MQTFFQKKLAWAKQKPLFWANALLGLVTVGVIFLFPGPIVSGVPSDFRIRTWSMILQLTGAYTVWKDLTATAYDFGKGNFLGSTWDWIKSGWRGHGHTLASGSIALAAASARARAKVRQTINSQATTLERLNTIEKLLGQIDDDLTGAYKEIDATRHDLEARVQAEESTRTAEIQAVKNQLDKAITGNITVLAFGAFWIFIGIVLSGWGPEIAKLVAGQWHAVWEAM